MAPKEIPDRWEPYIPIGSPVRGTRFIALKVPLKEHVCAKLQPKLRWTIDILTSSCPDIGMIVDFTMTTRYYDFVDVVNKGVDYCKVAIPGQQLPSESLVKRFFAAVDYYLDKRRDDSLIGIHCTHGVNRTGYMIARYMIQRMGISVSDALESITVARGHPIERQNYISDLGRHLEQMPKVLDASDIHRGRSDGEALRTGGKIVKKKKKPMDSRMGKDTVKRHGPARSANHEGSNGPWKKPRRIVDPWEPGFGPEAAGEFKEPEEERFDFKRTMNKRPPVKVWENDQNFDEIHGGFQDRSFPEPMEEQNFERFPRGEGSGRGGRGRWPGKRFPDKRPHFNDDRGPPPEFREDRGPPQEFRDDRGPPPSFREDHGQRHFREERPPPFREEHGPPHPFREERGPPQQFREERGMSPKREERRPPFPFREDRGPQSFREPPFREERGPPQHFRDESGPPAHFRGDREEKHGFNRGRSETNRRFGPREDSDKRFDSRGRHQSQDRDWEDNGVSEHMGDRRGFQGRMASPPSRMISGRQMSPTGRRIASPGRRMSPPGRRMSPERRTSPVGRRMSPPGRRVSPPGRRISPPSGRPMGLSGRRLSPQGQRTPPSVRRMSPQGRRLSPPQARRMSPSLDKRMASAPFGRMSPQPGPFLNIPGAFPPPQQRMSSPPRQRRKSPPRERIPSPHYQRMSPPRQRRISPPHRGISPPHHMGPRGSPPRMRGPELKRGPPPTTRGDLQQHPPFLGKSGHFDRPMETFQPRSRSPVPSFKPPAGSFDDRGRHPSPGLGRMRRSRSPGKRRSPPPKRRGSPLQGRMSPPPFKKDSRQVRSDQKNIPFEGGDFDVRKDQRINPVHAQIQNSDRPRKDNRGPPPAHVRKSPQRFSSKHDEPPNLQRNRRDFEEQRFSSKHDEPPNQQRNRRDFQEHRLGTEKFQGPEVNQRDEQFFPMNPKPFPSRRASPQRPRGRSPPPHIVADQYQHGDARIRPGSPIRQPPKEKEFPPRHIEGGSYPSRMGRQPFRSPDRSPARKDRGPESFKRDQPPPTRGRSREDRGRSKPNIEVGNSRPHLDKRPDGPTRMELGENFPRRSPPPPERSRFSNQQSGTRDDRYRSGSPLLSRAMTQMKPPREYSPRPKRSSSPGFPEMNDKGWDAELEQDCRELILQKRITSVSRSISGLSNSSITQRLDAVEDVIVIEDSSDPDLSRPPSRSRRRPVSSRLSPKLERLDRSSSPRSKKPVFDRLQEKKPPIFERLEDPSHRRSALNTSPRKPRGASRLRR
ncbi:hypothetical protein GE061_006958 [Apolygus lucorum]|uniref:Tyrosine specific protein phosphatases domain-containing protein n=1 Tax=Apolygus lucorum TaxID=248454 RepID=A0A6A4IN96_APOLU|nr:hypothetical protein GE061_006958 [Apolygus lucorum]